MGEQSHMNLTSLLTSIDWPSFAVPAISILEKIIRPILVYLFLIIALRVAGKREMAQLNTFDFIVLMLLSNTVQNAIIGNDNSVSGGLIGAISLLTVNYLVVRFLFKHQKLDALFEGKPDMLMFGGLINRKKLNQDLISVDELTQAARKQGIGSLAEVDSAELDPSGDISFVLKNQPAAAASNPQHAELLAAFQAVQTELSALRAEVRQLRSQPPQ
jgi:uncharacterized membrane protein YcaP (DUF421 family)